jgi:hypothetical protein
MCMFLLVFNTVIQNHFGVLIYLYYQSVDLIVLFYSYSLTLYRKLKSWNLLNNMGLFIDIFFLQIKMHLKSFCCYSGSLRGCIESEKFLFVCFVWLIHQFQYIFGHTLAVIPRQFELNHLSRITSQ